jgi:EAL domain-containing protein (putative c-di-GMP-specific phosphodiesterase class I)
MSPSVPQDARFPEIEDLVFYFQPIFGTDGVLRSYEALIRWVTESGSVRGPLDILPYHLHPDRIEAFTDFTIDSAAGLLTSRPDIPAVSINLSHQQISSWATVDSLAALPPEIRCRIQVELTEDRITDRDTYLRSVCQLSSLNIAVVLDDVTPQDSDERLVWSLPIRGVKLDRSLLPQLLRGQDPALNHFVYRLHAQQLQITAEGLGSPLWIPRLRKLGIEYFQGFGLGIPAPLPTVARLIKDPFQGISSPEKPRSRPLLAS